MSDLKTIVQDNFTRYAGNVILDRAICDVRDMLKPSARMLMYSQVHITKNTSNKPFVKSARVVGDCLGHYYTHGDGSCYSTYMRLAKPFAMRYPLEDCQGNVGTVTTTGDEAAPRYTELRLSKLGDSLFDDIDKDTIKDWYDNFDETDTYPKILPSKGFYNIVNGSTGIGVSLNASIPQFNLKEINNALITLIDDPNVEIDILPDFATGAILINPEEVKQSLKQGYGAACKIRSVVEYDAKERAFLLKEIPYGVYTDTISKQITKLVNEDPSCGIDHINDGSGKTPDYMIYLTKTANPDKVLKLLFKETSIQSYYTINMNVLVDNGRTPKTLGLKEMLIEYINHEKEVYRNSFNFDLKKISQRIHIIDGLLICLASIEEVVQLIKSAADTKNAKIGLMQKFLLSDVQADAVLNMKLSRLAHLEVKKLEDEKIDLQKEENRIRTILGDNKLFNNELKKTWEEVADKFGDERRTKILNLTSNGEEPIEVKSLMLNLTNQNNLFVTEASTLYTQRRGGVGNKFKVDKGEYVIDSTQGQTTDKILFFSNLGNVFYHTAADLSLNEKISVAALFDLKQNERINALIALTKDCDKDYIIFFTKQGYMKKSLLSEYTTVRKGGVKALELNDEDEIMSIVFTTKGKVGILTEQGQFLICRTDDVRPIGRVTRGVRGIKLNEGDSVMSARIIPEFTTQIVSISNQGYIKRTSINDFPQANRYTKGSKIQKLYDNGDWISDFLPIANENEVVIVSSRAQIRVKITEIPDLSKGAQGVKSISIAPLDRIIGLSKF